jgi:hypothetical protein
VRAAARFMKWLCGKGAVRGMTIPVDDVVIYDQRCQGFRSLNKFMQKVWCHQKAAVYPPCFDA